FAPSLFRSLARHIPQPAMENIQDDYVREDGPTRGVFTVAWLRSMGSTEAKVVSKATELPRVVKTIGVAATIGFLLQIATFAQFSYDTSFDSGTGFSFRPVFPAPFKAATLQKLILQGDGEILLVGDFDLFDGKPVSNLVRLNRDGTL